MKKSLWKSMKDGLVKQLEWGSGAHCVPLLPDDRCDCKESYHYCKHGDATRRRRRGLAWAKKVRKYRWNAFGAFLNLA